MEDDVEKAIYTATETCRIKRSDTGGQYHHPCKRTGHLGWGGGGGEVDFPAVKLAGKILRSVSERKILEPKRGMGKLERESQYGNFASPQLQEIRAINQMR